MKKKNQSNLGEAISREMQTEHIEQKPIKPKNKIFRENSNPLKNREAREHKVIDSLVGTLNEALEEDYDEIEEITEAVIENVETEESKPRRKALFIIGIFIVIMSIVGIVTTVKFTGDFIYSIADQTSLKKEFSQYLFPVVATDPPPFEAIGNMPPSVILTPALWNIIINEDTHVYERTADGFMIIPEGDVEVSARKLFGNGFEIVHQRVGDIELSFEYNSEIKSYIVQENPRMNSYAPIINSVSNSGNIYNVKVDYIVASALALAKIDYESEPLKTVIYKIKRENNKMEIQSVTYVVEGNQGF